MGWQHTEPPTTLYIAGEWQPASDGGTFPVIDPATEDVVADVADATQGDVARALESAEIGFARWRKTDAWQRAEILRRVATEIRANGSLFASTITTEQGKPLAEAESEVAAAAEQFDWFADEARRVYGRTLSGRSAFDRILVTREPVGVVAAFTAWNFPLILPSRKVAPALAAGCAILLKPAEETPLSALLLAAACEAAGVPKGTVNLLTGNPAAISEQLLRSDVVRKVTLTGSVPVGRTLLMASAEGIKAVSMELGGHAPAIVCEDVDVGHVAKLSAHAKFRNAGQVCASPSRFLVHASIAERFTNAFVDATQELVVGNGREQSTDVGPLSNARRVAATEALIEDAIRHGGKVMAGGQRCTVPSRGYFFEPTVLYGASSAMRIMREEPFAPIAPIQIYRDVDEVIGVSNETPYGLAGYLFTNDLKKMMTISDRLEVGMVGVNTYSVAPAEAPFGGVKQSGFGRESGTEAIDSYTVTKAIHMSTSQET